MKFTNLHELYSEVARRADTTAQHIGADEVSRVSSKLFEVLAELPAHEVLILVGLGLQAKASK
jgi:hypothetical protein